MSMLMKHMRDVEICPLAHRPLLSCLTAMSRIRVLEGMGYRREPRNSFVRQQLLLPPPPPRRKTTTATVSTTTTTTPASLSPVRTNLTFPEISGSLERNLVDQTCFQAQKSERGTSTSSNLIRRTPSPPTRGPCL